MLKELLKNTKLLSKIYRIYEENENEILDIVIFGSFVKGKDKPKDMDVLLIYKSKINAELSYNIKKEFEAFNLEVDLVSKAYNDLFKSAFVARESYLSEGYSLVQRGFISEKLGFKPAVLFRYGLSNLNKSERMRFYYSLYGRNSEGIIKKLDLTKFSERILISPIDKSEEAKEYLDNWKIKYLEMPILMPSRILESEAFKEK